jgi:thiol-disulfide isomerase/thioredoxin
MRIIHASALAIMLGYAATCLGEETAGIGIAMRMQDNRVVVYKVLPETPAARSGEIHVGDRLLTIANGDDPPVWVETISEAARMLHGPPGSTVHLRIIPAGKTQTEPHTVTLVRQTFDGLWGDGKLLKDGSEAPDFSFINLSTERPGHVSDHRGKIVLLTFWASWCGACEPEMAKLQTLLDQHPSWKGKVVILAVNVDEHREDGVKRLREKGWEKTQNVWSDSASPRAYHVERIPTTYVIAADGKVRAANPQDAAEVVEKLNK